MNEPKAIKTGGIGSKTDYHLNLTRTMDKSINVPNGKTKVVRTILQGPQKPLVRE